MQPFWNAQDKKAKVRSRAQQLPERRTCPLYHLMIILRNSYAEQLLLGRHFEDFVQGQLSSGRYKNASEVLRDALRLMEERERRLASAGRFHCARHCAISRPAGSMMRTTCSTSWRPSWPPCPTERMYEGRFSRPRPRRDCAASPSTSPAITWRAPSPSWANCGGRQPTSAAIRWPIPWLRASRIAASAAAYSVTT